MKPRFLAVFNRQEEADPSDLRGAVVAVIDVLRATSTMAAALSAGAAEIRCFGTVREAFRARKMPGAHGALLCGERNGRRVRGFDLGNSPRDFTPGRCAGKTLIMTTTNGTRALRLTSQAGDVIAASFMNLSAVTDYLAASKRPIVILCAGTEGMVSVEDVACAGAIAERLEKRGVVLDESARAAIRTWRRARRSMKKFLLGSKGGIPLKRIGLERDVFDCARIDRLSAVPRLAGRAAGYRIILARGSK